MLKICRVCDTIIGELDTDESKNQGIDYSLDIIGNVAYTLCPRCMGELDMDRMSYYH